MTNQKVTDFVVSNGAVSLDGPVAGVCLPLERRPPELVMLRKALDI